MGRALDAQKFFHDVNYEHRLRDSRHELYQFQERINAIQSSSNAAPDSPVPNSPVPTEAEDIEDHRSDVANFPTATTSTSSNPSSRDDTLPNGVFTVLTDCYSPTCSREALCYSPSCPRRLEQVMYKSHLCYSAGHSYMHGCYRHVALGVDTLDQVANHHYWLKRYTLKRIPTYTQYANAFL